MKFSAVILAGGKSSRMGSDKAFLPLGAQTLLARQIETARATGAAEMFISGRAGVDYSSFGLPVLHDEFAEAGPLAGVHAALGFANFPLLLVLAVDLPEMNSGILQKTLAGADGQRGSIPRVKGNPEPLAAFYPVSALPLCAQFLGAGRRSARQFAAACVEAELAAFVDLSEQDEIFFANWNAPVDIDYPRSASGATGVGAPSLPELPMTPGPAH